MDRNVALGILMAGCVLFVSFYRGPKLTNREAVWALWGMFFGAIFWIVAIVIKLPHIYPLSQPNPLTAVTLIGGLLGWIAAKVFRVKSD
jgi:hypothetical protein